MKHSLLFINAVLASALTATAPACASERDNRITTKLFEASTIVSLRGRVGIQSTVAFALDERIENVAVGDSQAWQVTPNKRADLLFVKPTTLHARTNMTVVTDQHTYLFDLVATPGVAPVYMLRFTYPAPLRLPAKPLVNASAAAAPTTTRSLAEPRTADPAAFNFAWSAAGDKALVPSRWFDDGRRVYLAWSKESGLPAILTRAPTGAEGPVNYMVQGDYVVVEGVPPQLVLRLGKQVATLTQLRRIAPTAANPAPPILTSLNSTPVLPGDGPSYDHTASAQP